MFENQHLEESACELKFFVFVVVLFFFFFTRNLNALLRAKVLKVVRMKCEPYLFYFRLRREQTKLKKKSEWLEPCGEFLFYKADRCHGGDAQTLTAQK